MSGNEIVNAKSPRVFLQPIQNLPERARRLETWLSESDSVAGMGLFYGGQGISSTKRQKQELAIKRMWKKGGLKRGKK